VSIKLNKKIYPFLADILLILGFAIIVGNNLFWSGYQEVIAQPQPSQSQSLLTYTDSVCAIRIQYPSGWEAVGFGSGGASFTVPKTTDGLSVTIFPLSSSSPAQSLDSHPRNTIDSLRQSLGQNFQLISSSKTTLAGNPALVTEYRYRITGNEQQDEVTRTMDVSISKGNKLYTLSYSAQETEYPRYLSTIRNMISTFVFGSPSSACRPDPAMFGSLVGPRGVGSWTWWNCSGRP
jgi:hypothetical protein